MNIALKFLSDIYTKQVIGENSSTAKLNLFSCVTELAYHAMFVEVHLSPKPGLVDLVSNGSHNDMNVHLFEISASSIRPFLKEFILAGKVNSNLDEKSLLSILRPIGMKAEESMFQATQGINTHKGMIFALGLVCGAIGWLEGNGITINSSNISRMIKNCCSQLVVDELEQTKQTSETHGEKIFRQFGLTGARGEAASGFHTVMNYSLPSYRKALSEGASTEQALWQVLLTLMAYNQDTNVVSRGGMHGLKYVQNSALTLLEQGGWHDENLESKLLQLDTKFIELNLSPGGSADLLAITWLLAEIDQLSNVQKS